MLAYHVLQQVYDLAHCLHADTGVALSVAMGACERPTYLRRLRGHRAGRYRLRLPEDCQQARFQHMRIFLDDNHTLHTRPPTANERQLVHRALALLFTPWGCPHVPPPVPDQPLLTSHFAEASARSDWGRIHTLIDPTYTGLRRLIREDNEDFPRGSDECPEDPNDKLAIPCFVL
ncbi:MAG TPA: hypothetical protein VHN13_18035 [Candidatus Tectomicrobia bacterium]|nr:hypothetical protein [Candidatus Tectomicrobia bacterium]